MLHLQHVYKSYGDTTVLSDVSLSANPGEIIALIGGNGAGKTTLLKLLLGEIKPDSGTVLIDGETVGYVPQVPPGGMTVAESFADSLQPWEVDRALALVGLDDVQPNVLLDTLSGGQRTRAAFAHVLAGRPTILLLDEPTNNLDGSGLRWLTGFLSHFQGCVVVASHDRAFINQVATHILELDGGTLQRYGGNYDLYKQQKEIAFQGQLERFEKSQEEKRRLTRAITAQSENSQHTQKHIKRSDHDTSQRNFFRNRVAVKYGQQTKALAARLAQVEDVERPLKDRSYAIGLHGELKGARLCLRLDDVFVGHDRPILSHVTFELRGNERIHLSGANGSGKTTLLRAIAGLEGVHGGAITFGSGIRFGYFSQDNDGLDYSRTALDNLVYGDQPLQTIYRETRSLGLTPSDLRKKLSEFSRGEQAKFAFARLLLRDNHLLMLDEPTNHLDILTREQIEAALEDYRGGLLVASHDDYFLNRISITRTLRISGGNVA